ncbi:MAG: MBL fold metallo-hydrolase [Clostridia bacterium]|nr:MBL fold metallo-hydrolase [Clostridia bacterium]
MRKKLRFVVLIACVFCLLSISFPDIGQAPLTVRFLDVGQGDAILLRTADGDVLIDAGTEQSETLLCLRMEQLGVRSLKLAIFTHFDEDHIGGADAVLRQFPTETVWINHSPVQNEATNRLLLAAEESGAQLRRVCAGEHFQLGDLFLAILYPLNKNPAEGNASGLIVRMQFGKTSALFMGDAGIAQENTLIEQYEDSDLSVDLCKVGHHGSNSSTSERFLTVTDPTYAVISAGTVNVFGHPSGEVLARLKQNGTETLCTGWQGEIVFESNGELLLPAEGS